MLSNQAASWGLLLIAVSSLQLSVEPARAQTAETKAQPITGSPPQTDPADTVESRAHPANEARPASPIPDRAPDLVVSARRPDVQRFVDRRSYAIDKNINYDSGSVGDVLKSLPSVDVDPNGTVSLRGDARVTILIDGQPAPIFEGQSRSSAIESLPANRFDHVEIMTNPSAAYSPEGAAGVINLVTRKALKSEESLSVTAYLDTSAEGGARASSTITKPGISIASNVNYRHQINEQRSSSRGFVADPQAGNATKTEDQSASHRQSETVSGQSTLDIRPSKDTHIITDITLNYTHFYGHNDITHSSTEPLSAGDEDYSNRALTPGVLLSATIAQSLRYAISSSKQIYGRAAITYGYSRFWTINDYQYSDISLTPSIQRLQVSSPHYSFITKFEYRDSSIGGASLLVGYDGRLDLFKFSHLSYIGPTPRVVTLADQLSNVFGLDQATTAVYSTVEKELGMATVLLGVRGELTDIDDRQITLLSHENYSYAEIYPTAHFKYDFKNFGTLTASYGRRIQRPGPESLNPFVVYASPLSSSTGNARLKPNIIDSFEVGHDLSVAGVTLSSNIFYRYEHSPSARIASNGGGGSFLYRYENVGHAEEVGVEFSTTAKISKMLDISADATFAQSTILDVTSVPFAYRSHERDLAHLKANWKVTSRDFIQTRFSYTGRTATAQGFQRPLEFLDAGYRHEFSKRFSLSITADDVFGTFATKRHSAGPYFLSDDMTDFRIRAVRVSLSYKMGGFTKQSGSGPDFEYSTGN